MRRQQWRRAIQGTLLAAGLWLVAGGTMAADPPAVPDADYPKMLKYCAKGIQDALKGTPKDEQVAKARTAAIVLAACAQQNLEAADGQLRATVRDAALKIAATIDAKKYADAVKQAGDLASLTANASAKKEKVKLIDSHVRTGELMQQFKRPPEGGWGIDSKLYAYRLGMKSKIPDAELKEQLMLEAYQIAVTADQLLQRTITDKPKEWQGFATEVHKGAIQLAEAIKARDGSAGMDAVAKITTNCTGCHKAFRASK